MKQFLDSVKHGGAHSFYKRAIELGVKINPLKEDSRVVKLSYDKKIIYMRRNTVPLLKKLGGFTRDKFLTKSVLRDAKISVPKGIVVNSFSDFAAKTRNSKINFPLIAKPLEGTRAKGVTWNIQNIKELKSAILASQEAKNCPVMVEEMFLGDELRVLVFGDKVVSAVQKIPAGIVGDGVSNIKQLIDCFNKTRRPDLIINLDDIALRSIKEQGFSLASVLPDKYFLKLRNNLNMSDGGRCIDRTKNLHPNYKEACIKAVASLNLQFGGVDIIVKKIDTFGRYVILEVNPSPYFNMHEAELVEGRSVDVAALILKDIFPKLKIK